VDGAKVGLPLADDLLDGLAEFRHLLLLLGDLLLLVGDLLLLLSDLLLLQGEGAAYEAAEFIVGVVGALDGALDALQPVIGKLALDAVYALVEVVTIAWSAGSLGGHGRLLSV
jgi:hypothetical protein